jgi:hypothetical protein
MRKRQHAVRSASAASSRQGTPDAPAARCIAHARALALQATRGGHAPEHGRIMGRVCHREAALRDAAEVGEKQGPRQRAVAASNQAQHLHAPRARARVVVALGRCISAASNSCVVAGMTRAKCARLCVVCRVPGVVDRRRSQLPHGRRNQVHVRLGVQQRRLLGQRIRRYRMIREHNE